MPVTPRVEVWIEISKGGYDYIIMEEIHKIDSLKMAKEVTGKTDVAELMLFLEDNVSIYASSYDDGTEIISEVFSDFYSDKKTSEFTTEFIRRCLK